MHSKTLTHPNESLPSLQERAQKDSAVAYRAIVKLRPK